MQILQARIFQEKRPASESRADTQPLEHGGSSALIHLTSMIEQANVNQDRAQTIALALQKNLPHVSAVKFRLLRPGPRRILGMGDQFDEAKMGAFLAEFCLSRSPDASLCDGQRSGRCPSPRHVRAAIQLREP